MSYIAFYIFYRSSTSVLVIVCDLIVSDSAAATAALLPGIVLMLLFQFILSLVSHHSCSLVHWFWAAVSLAYYVRFFFFTYISRVVKCGMLCTTHMNAIFVIKVIRISWSDSFDIYTWIREHTHTHIPYSITIIFALVLAAFANTHGGNSCACLLNPYIHQFTFHLKQRHLECTM